MSAGWFGQANFNAVVVGNGAIGSALAQTLLQHPNLGKLLILQRSNTALLNDPRVSVLPFDAENPESIAAAAQLIGESAERVHVLLNTVGMLHSAEQFQQQPEKRLADVELASLQRSMLINAMLLPMLAKAFGRLLRHKEPAVLASLSARVGSIEDNSMGGWYSYRASKAAHNMLLRTIANEWRLSHRNAAIFALHPGTVQSKLSEPFVSPNYKHTVHTPEQCAQNLLNVLANLTLESSGGFYDWQGKAIPW
ncbi:MAG: SDR family NAD(P)-dependent oxidoreductase [Halioglobus sp.]